MSTENRFLAKYEEDANGCWRWTGTITRKGYGQLWDVDANVAAHRFSYQFFVGEIPEGLQLDHTCRVKDCVNPNHLEVVTNQENVKRSVPYWKIKTHCPSGHPYDTTDHEGYKSCKQCHRETQRRYKERLKASKV